MTDLNQHILVRLIPDGECIGIRTYSREAARALPHYPRFAGRMVEREPGARIL